MRRSKEVKKLQAKSLGNNILKFWMVLVFFLFIGIQGCSLFSGGGTTSSTEGDGQGEPQGPFSKGILQGVAHIAPVNTKAAVLAGIASQLGWENDVTQNTLLRDAAENGDFEEKVEPYLLTLFYKKGFSVLPSVGEGHEFSRDSIIMGRLMDVKFLVTTKEQVRLVFLQPVGQVQVVYPQDGTQPLIFVPNPNGVVVVRRSLLEQYLR